MPSELTIADLYQKILELDDRITSIRREDADIGDTLEGMDNRIDKYETWIKAIDEIIGIGKVDEDEESILERLDRLEDIKEAKHDYEDEDDETPQPKPQKEKHVVALCVYRYFGQGRSTLYFFGGEIRKYSGKKKQKVSYFWTPDIRKAEYVEPTKTHDAVADVKEIYAELGEATEEEGWEEIVGFPCNEPFVAHVKWYTADEGEDGVIVRIKEVL